jgi:F-type H+-transporting ATPase subunit delta
MTTKHQAKREAKHLLKLCVSNGRLDETRVSRVSQLLANADRRGAHAMLRHFLRMVMLTRARHTASVESAVPLTADLRTGLESGLIRRFGWGLKTTFIEQPELIGGVRIRVGSDLYDGSVRTALLKLERAF